MDSPQPGPRAIFPGFPPMKLSFSTTPSSEVPADWLILLLPEGFTLEGEPALLNQALGGLLERLRAQQDFQGKLGELCQIPAPAGIAAQRLLLAGLGPVETLSVRGLNRTLQTAARAITSRATRQVALSLRAVQSANIAPATLTQLAMTAFEIGSEGQDLFRAEKKRHPIEELIVLSPTDANPAELAAAATTGHILGEAVNLARRLVNLPAEEIYPESFALKAVELASGAGIHCEVLDQHALESEKMGSLLAVARGSDRPPRVVILEYRGAPGNGHKVLGLVGKGVTFDSGGLSLKPTDGMLTMKCDMAGAASVLASVVAIARLKLPVNVIGMVGLVENMTGGRAMKLGDVLHSRRGVSIEVQNTDAEGRLVLADVLDLALSRGVDYLVDLATLTGACVVALGEDVVGAMSNNQAWCDRVLGAAQAAGEDAWQLPMFDHYADLIKSDVADIRNVGGRWGGAITAAKFLERFVGDKPWVHLDIAGPAFAAADKPHREGGGTGVMVRTLVELARTM